MTRTRVVVKIQSKPQQVIEDALLIARDQIVTDLCKLDRLNIAGKAAQHENAEDRATDDPDETDFLFVENLVDHGLHKIGERTI